MIHPRCPQTFTELQMPKYRRHGRTNEIVPKSEDRDNHRIDALGYAWERIWNRSGELLMSIARKSAPYELTPYEFRGFDAALEHAMSGSLTVNASTAFGFSRRSSAIAIAVGPDLQLGGAGPPGDRACIPITPDRTPL